MKHASRNDLELTPLEVRTRPLSTVRQATNGRQDGVDGGEGGGMADGEHKGRKKGCSR